MPSRLPRSNNDALSRRDLGLEFLDVTRQVDTALVSSKRMGVTQQEDVYRITNTGSSPVDTHLLLIATGLSGQVQMENASGTTGAHYPYLRVFLSGGALLPGQSTVQTLQFKALPHVLPTATYVLTLLSGQGNP